VRLEFDARGEPRHVWIEPGADPLPDGVRAALDRGLRRWRLAPGVPVRRGDVRIRYQPGAPWTAFGIPSDPG
jgi:hypothetical protein